MHIDLIKIWFLINQFLIKVSTVTIFTPPHRRCCFSFSTYMHDWLREKKIGKLFFSCYVHKIQHKCYCCCCHRHTFFVLPFFIFYYFFICFEANFSQLYAYMNLSVIIVFHHQLLLTCHGNNFFLAHSLNYFYYTHKIILRSRETNIIWLLLPFIAKALIWLNGKMFCMDEYSQLNFLPSY